MFEIVLMTSSEYCNYFKISQERCPGDIGRYNDIIQHETLRVAVCGMLENETSLTIPEALSEVMDKTFLEFYDYYESSVRKKLHLHGQHMQVIRL
jgi:ubiquitin-conjugating enzyme E2 Z